MENNVLDFKEHCSIENNLFSNMGYVRVCQNSWEKTGKSNKNKWKISATLHANPRTFEITFKYETKSMLLYKEFEINKVSSTNKCKDLEKVLNSEDLVGCITTLEKLLK